MPPVWIGGRGEKRLLKSFVEQIAAFEILVIVRVGFGEQAGFDQIENDVPEIFAPLKAPFVEDEHGHGPIDLQGISANALEQFLAADVADAFLGVADDILLGVIQGVSHERVSLAVIPRIALHDLFNRFIEIHCFHNHFVAVETAGVGWWLSRHAFTAQPMSNRNSAMHNTSCCGRVKYNIVRCRCPIQPAFYANPGRLARCCVGEFDFPSRALAVGSAAMKLPRLAAGLLAGALLTGCAHRHGGAYDFALIGDVPYTEKARTNMFPNMIRDINDANVAFVVHDGDIKSGSSPCTDEEFRKTLAQFQTFEHPLFFLFGDNEWQDCGSNKTNKFEPMERLTKLREIFCPGNASLGRRTLPLERQSAEFPENIRWRHGDVLFAGFNIPGAANNYGKREFDARNAANCTWLKEAFAAARAQQCRGVMLVIQANPHFDLASTNQARRGFNEWLGILQHETVAFGKPVVLVHGDSHYFRIDKPMMAKGRVQHFTRVETFGYPDVHWLRATVDPKDPNVFSFHIQLVEKNLPRSSP